MPDADLPTHEPGAPPAPGAEDADCADAPAGTDPLDVAAAAILGYLNDLAECRDLCLRYRDSAGVLPFPHAMHLIAAAERTPGGDLARVRAAVEALPPAGRWRGCLPWEEATADAGRAPLARHALWEEEPVYVRVVPMELGLVRVDLVLPDRPALPRLPLCAAASALRCLEFLLPHATARPAPLAELGGPPPLGLWEYLRRATPERVPSGKCIWPLGAGQSPDPADSSPPSP